MSDSVHTVAIVGGGPAGIAVALALRARGVSRVTILEREERLGGVPRHCGHPPFGVREFHRVLTGPGYARRLEDAARTAGVDIRPNTSVVALNPTGRLDVTTPGGRTEIHATRVLLATGARETPRSARLLSGDRPIGIITTGTLQHSIYIEGLKPFERPLIVGTELVSLSAVLTCWKAGIRPVAIVEAGPRPTARRPLDLFPRLLGVPMYYRADIVDVEGTPRVEKVAIRLSDGGLRELACDGLLLTGCFVPESSLARTSHLMVDPGSGGPCIDQFGRCSDPTYFAAGNLLRPIETAGWSFREGTRIGGFIADDLAGSLPPADETIDVKAGQGIKLAVPQRISLAGVASGLGSLQLRVNTGATGEMVVRRGDAVLWRRRMSVLPERRILIPLATIAAAGEAHGAITITFMKHETD
jgi:NADPH-dependent 2,4-dienoyl-CoA reductase/sulfur reductase-like enzyme